MGTIFDFTRKRSVDKTDNAVKLGMGDFPHTDDTKLERAWEEAYRAGSTRKGWRV